MISDDVKEKFQLAIKKLNFALEKIYELPDDYPNKSRAIEGIQSIIKNVEDCLIEMSENNE